MPHIAITPPSQADHLLEHTYKQIEEVMGRVPSAFQLFSQSPELMRQQWEFITYYLKHPTLSGQLLAFMRVCVSSEIECDYCIGLNSGLLVTIYGWTTEQLAAAKLDLNNAPLSDKEKLLLSFCLDSVRRLGRVDPARLDELRENGWTDKDILDAVLHASRNVASDIVFNTFGLEQDTFV